MLCCVVSGERNFFVIGGVDKCVYVWDIWSMMYIIVFVGYRGVITGFGFRYGIG